MTRSVYLADVLDRDELDRCLAEGLVARREHPAAPLAIYNYTARAQFQRAWCPSTLACRGLIVDQTNWRVLARPFPKFFNLNEHSPESGLPAVPIGDPFDAFEKLDGSLGISYRLGGEVCIATRGAFASEQALWATDWWRRRFRDVEIPEGQTWLFEIIYPENRIVVNYGDRRDLVLLAVIDTATGADLSLPSGEDWPGDRAHRFDAATVEDLLAQATDDGNSEGFVIRFQAEAAPSLRVKVKLAEYLRLHRLVTGITTKTIWEHLAAGHPIAELMERAPDEFLAWAYGQAGEQLRAFHAIAAKCHAALADPRVNLRDRKATAELFKSLPHTPILFKMLDRQPFEALIWKELRPVSVRPFREENPNAP